MSEPFQECPIKDSCRVLGKGAHKVLPNELWSPIMAGITNQIQANKRGRKICIDSHERSCLSSSFNLGEVARERRKIHSET